MKSKVYSAFKYVGIIAVMAAVLLSVWSVHTVQAATARASSASTVSKTKPGYGIVSIGSGASVNVYSSDYGVNQISGAGFSNGDYVMIVGLGSSGNYYQVMYDTNGNYGYVSKSYVTFKSTSKYLKVTGVTSGSHLNMRAGASTSATIVASLPANAYFAYIGETTNSGEWYNGVYGNQHGYCYGDYVQEFTF